MLKHAMQKSHKSKEFSLFCFFSEMNLDLAMAIYLFVVLRSTGYCMRKSLHKLRPTESG